MLFRFEFVLGKRCNIVRFFYTARFFTCTSGWITISHVTLSISSSSDFVLSCLNARFFLVAELEFLLCFRLSFYISRDAFGIAESDLRDDCSVFTRSFSSDASIIDLEMQSISDFLNPNEEGIFV